MPPRPVEIDGDVARLGRGHKQSRGIYRAIGRPVVKPNGLSSSSSSSVTRYNALTRPEDIKSAERSPTHARTTRAYLACARQSVAGCERRRGDDSIGGCPRIKIARERVHIYTLVFIASGQIFLYAGGQDGKDSEIRAAARGRATSNREISIYHARIARTVLPVRFGRNLITPATEVCNAAACDSSIY